MSRDRLDDPWVAPPRPSVQGPSTPRSYSFAPARALPLDSEPGCHSTPELFFEPDTYQAAKAMCRRCPAREACLELGRDEQEGVWGGLTPAERRHPGRTRRKLPPVPDARAGQRERMGVPPAHEWMPPPRKRKKRKKRKKDRPLAQVIAFPMERISPHVDGRLCLPNVDTCWVCYPDE